MRQPKWYETGEHIETLLLRTAEGKCRPQKKQQENGADVSGNSIRVQWNFIWDLIGKEDQHNWESYLSRYWILLRFKHSDNLAHLGSLFMIWVNTPQSCQKGSFQGPSWWPNLNIRVNHLFWPAAADHHFQPINQIHLRDIRLVRMEVFKFNEDETGLHWKHNKRNEDAEYKGIIPWFKMLLEANISDCKYISLQCNGNGGWASESRKLQQWNAAQKTLQI